MTILRQGAAGGREEHGEMVEVAGLAVGQNASGQPKLSARQQVSFSYDSGWIVFPMVIGAPMYMTFAGIITVSALSVFPTGSMVLDILKNGISITASAKPTVVSGDVSVDSTLTGWTKTFAAGDTLRVQVISATSVQAFVLSLDVTRT